jgi:hypothetical protein
MPVILAPDTWARWLGEQGATPDELKSLPEIGSVRNRGCDVAELATPSA